MKKKISYVLVALGLCAFHNVRGQEARVDSSTSGIQTGFLGIYAHNEARITHKIALRTEIGMNLGLYGGALHPRRIGFDLTPVFTVEPRWYYNLDKRIAKGKKISGNSGNFLTVQTSFNPSWFGISSDGRRDRVGQISITPMWGIKRNIGKHFTFETGTGIGVGRYLKPINESKPYFGGLSLHLRFGYRF